MATFKLRVKVGNTDFISDLRELSDGAAVAICDYGLTHQNCNWSKHEEDLKSFTTAHPEVLFELQCNGEYLDDQWIKYFQNGQMQVCRARIVYDEFDHKKLS